MDESKKSILKYNEIKNSKGQIILHPVILHDTPQTEIDRMNKYFTEWKDTVQVEYDRDGMRIK